MYVKTDKSFINYKFNNVYYKIPTFGKLYKIIDFGRAIYSFKGKTNRSPIRKKQKSFSPT